MPLAPRCVWALAFGFADGGSECWDDFEEIADDAVIRDLEDGRIFILIDGHDALRAFHADQVLDGSADADGEVDLGRDGLAGAADLALHG